MTLTTNTIINNVNKQKKKHKKHKIANFQYLMTLQNEQLNLH